MSANIGEEPPAQDEQPARDLAWEACYNVRDLGGYATASGRLIRWLKLRTCIRLLLRLFVHSSSPQKSMVG